MDHTTQAQLEKLAEKHANNAAVSALRTTLLESRAIVGQAHFGIDAFLGIQRRALAGEPGFSVALDHSDFVKAAATAAAALSRMACAYSNLACVLQSLGEDICY